MIDIKGLTIKIKRLLLDKSQLRQELSESFSINMRTSKTRLKLRKFMEEKDLLDTDNVDVINIESTKTGVILPKSILKKFSGDLLEWKPFQEAYEAAIENNKQFLVKQKFSYLSGYFEGTAFQAIEEFPFTLENYRHG